MDDLLAKFTDATAQQYLAAFVALVWLVGISIGPVRRRGGQRSAPLFRWRGKRGTRFQRTAVALAVFGALCIAGVLLNRSDFSGDTTAIFDSLRFPHDRSQETLPGAIPEGAVLSRIKRISDGDTIVLADDTRVRLFGIDAPERDQPFGREATRLLERLLDSTVYVDIRDRDSYGRVVAVLYTPDGLDVNEAMVCAGAAWWYEWHARREWHLAHCQTVARRERIGLWQADDPDAPWDWRRR